MEYQRIILVHYHEIGLKGKNRASFEERLLRNIQSLLHSYPVVTIHRISGRLVVFLKEGVTLETALACATVIARVPGVARVSTGIKCARELDVMKEAALQVLNESEPFVTFKVHARRNHTDFPIGSMELNQVIGAHLCEGHPEKTVKMKDPDVTIGVEVIQNATYIYGSSIPGIGGLPVGSSGRVMALLSSGIDSPVALWRMARRGAVPIAVHFSGRPQTSDASEFLVDDIAKVLEASGSIARVYVVPFGDYQREISLLAPPPLRIILYRRLMMRVAQALAYKEQAGALVTGESLGQVASQTLENIQVTDAIATLPVFRPLIGADKIEIIAQAQQLGTFEISSSDAPDCCTLFMPRSPETHARLSKVEEAEAQFPIDEWVQELVEHAEIHDYSCPAYKPKRSQSK